MAYHQLDFQKLQSKFITVYLLYVFFLQNVFIAVITETFNEIRVQFQQMWGERGTIQTQSTAQVFLCKLDIKKMFIQKMTKIYLSVNLAF